MSGVVFNLEMHSEGKMPRTSSDQGSELSRSSIRVLVVDDFYPTASALVNILSTNFYDARAAHTAAEALRIAQEFRPNALITDVILPDMDGFRFAVEIERLCRDCKVLLTSASVSDSKEVNGMLVVPKAILLEETFRLLDDYRRSEAI
jgi:PleD family two-component response regulator